MHNEFYLYGLNTFHKKDYIDLLLFQICHGDI